MGDLATTLRHMVSDRSLSGEDRELAAGMLAMMPRLKPLLKDGHGRLTAVVVGGKVKRVEATFTDNVEG